MYNDGQVILLELVMTRLSDISEDRYSEMYRNSPADLIGRVGTFPCEEDRRMTVVAYDIVRRRIAELTGNDNVRIFADGRTKPYSDSEICFSIAHSFGMIAVVFSDREVGVDTEKIRKVNMRIAEKYFSQKEREYILSSENPEESFFTVWTLKEAWLKCNGKGLEGGIQSVCFSFDGGNIRCSDEGYSFFLFKENGFVTAVCEKKLF